jgi:hypothetical protein
MPAMATMSPASASSIGSGLEAAEGQDLGDAELLDPLPSRRQRLDHRVAGA